MASLLPGGTGSSSSKSGGTDTATIAARASSGTGNTATVARTAPFAVFSTSSEKIHDIHRTAVYASFLNHQHGGGWRGAIPASVRSGGCRTCLARRRLVLSNGTLTVGHVGDAAVDRTTGGGGVDDGFGVGGECWMVRVCSAYNRSLLSWRRRRLYGNIIIIVEIPVYHVDNVRSTFGPSIRTARFEVGFFIARRRRRLIVVVVC